MSRTFHKLGRRPALYFSLPFKLINAKITSDHTLVNLLVQSGELTEKEAKDHPKKNVLMKALGANVTADIDVFDINTSFILFERKTPEVDALIAINRTGDPIPTPLPEKYYNIDTIYPLGVSNTRSIDSHGGIVLKKVKK